MYLVTSTVAFYSSTVSTKNTCEKPINDLEFEVPSCKAMRKNLNGKMMAYFPTFSLPSR